MNKHNVVICPACGSQRVSRSEYENSNQLTLGSKFSFKEVLYTCNTCGEEGDFFAETDKNYLAAQKAAQLNLIKKILEDLHSNGISMALIERVFELPPRTLTRWKNGDFSSSALSLLRIIFTYPWIIEVAENKFEKNISCSAILTAAAQEIKDQQINMVFYSKKSNSTSTTVVNDIHQPIKKPPTSL